MVEYLKLDREGAQVTGFNRLNEFQGMRVVFVSTRIAGSDGVSLEIEKWAQVLERLGIECYYIAGECDRPSERTAIIDQAHFRHPSILAITEQAFKCGERDLQLTDTIMRQARIIRRQLNQALDSFGIQAVIASEVDLLPPNVSALRLSPGVLGNDMVWGQNNLKCADTPSGWPLLVLPKSKI